MTGPGRVRVLDLEHQGLSGAIGATLILEPEPVLVDPGPATTLDRLESAAGEAGMPLSEVRHLCLTHVHLDHAGAAGHLARRFPRLQLHIHEEGAPHLVSPERLVASTRRTFGEAHDRLWGEVIPVPEHRIRVWRPRERGPLPWLRALPTPGHIGHHLAYLDEVDGVLVAGDALGIILSPESPTHPPTPPPAVDLAAWEDTLDSLERVSPERAVVSHFGMHADVASRVEGLRSRSSRPGPQGAGRAGTRGRGPRRRGLRRGGAGGAGAAPAPGAHRPLLRQLLRGHRLRRRAALSGAPRLRLQSVSPLDAAKPTMVPQGARTKISSMP